jgi:hypothetical protein
LANCRRAAVGDPRAASRSINHELHSAIPRPASAENLQMDFSSRLNKGLRRIVSPAAVVRRRLRVEIVDGFGIADVLVLVFDIVAGRPASPGVISPQASAVVTAFIARDTLCGDGSSISPLPMTASDDSDNVPGRSRHRGSTCSRHIFIADMSPASAASTALRVNPRASPSSKVAAASGALFREPRRRPAGMPDRPGWKSRLRPRAGGRGKTWSLIELLRVVTCFYYIQDMALRQ